MTKEIHIDEVIACLRSVHESADNCCRLKFILSTGPAKGDERIVPRARYGAPRRTVATQKDGGRPRSKRAYEHNDNGTLPMTNVDGNRYFTPLISHIVGYNDFRVIH